MDSRFSAWLNLVFLHAKKPFLSISNWQWSNTHASAIAEFTTALDIHRGISAQMMSQNREGEKEAFQALGRAAYEHEVKTNQRLAYELR
jgi:hypothetical protein